MSQEPLLSVCLITYNHEKYIREALDGIFMQEVDFPMEIIIADDCSTDNTRAIIMEYYEKYSDEMRLIFQEKNVGPAQNWLDLMNAPKGKYIAYLEGDDYWTDPLKLQKQVDFLEVNSDFNICFHKTPDLVNGKLIDKSSFLGDIPKQFTLADITKFNFINTCSVVFRNHQIVIPDWFKIIKIGDYPFWMLLAEKGKIYYLPEPMAVYRFGNGSHTTLSTIEQLKRMNFVLSFMQIHFKDNPVAYQNITDYYERNCIQEMQARIYENTFSAPQDVYKTISFKGLIYLVIHKAKSKMMKKWK